MTANAPDQIIWLADALSLIEGMQSFGTGQTSPVLTRAASAVF